MGRLLLGADLVDVREVEESINTFGQRYLERVYTPAEIAYALASPSEQARRLGARFAVKEATIKALRASEDGVDPRSIEVVRTAGGACEVALSGAASVAARRAGALSLSVTLSHQGHLAMAVVVAERANSPRSRIFTRSTKGAHRR